MDDSNVGVLCIVYYTMVDEKILLNSWSCFTEALWSLQCALLTEHVPVAKSRPKATKYEKHLLYVNHIFA